MATKNKESTRYYNNLQEERVAKLLNAYRQSNSGASTFAAGDVYNKNASILIECKTCMTNKDSFSIKKEWLIKNKEEAKSKRLSNNCLAFSTANNNLLLASPEYATISNPIIEASSFVIINFSFCY